MILLKRKHLSCRILFFGHSWGSMLARAYASIYGEDIKGMMCGVCSQWQGCGDAYVNAEFKAAMRHPYQPCGVRFERVFCGMTDRVENQQSGRLVNRSAHC